MTEVSTGVSGEGMVAMFMHVTTTLMMRHVGSGLGENEAVVQRPADSYAAHFVLTCVMSRLSLL